MFITKVGEVKSYTVVNTSQEEMPILGRFLNPYIVVQFPENAGQLARPYMKSSLTIQEIMSTGKGIPDATFKGGMNWKVPGTFRGSQGIWELGINPKTNVIYHFNFVH